ncbi:MAG: YfcE family phosphodiesterase [Dehalococcoidia bacterium]|nr:YfcE family phosphodiesterase [Dehalococcoidia bacterium]
MKIGLISDTHIPSMGKEPPPQVALAFQGVDLILHAGDIYIPSCIEWLERIAPVKASMAGTLSLREAATRASEPIVVEAEGHTIGLVHELVLPGMNDDLFPGAMAKRYPARLSLPNALQNIFGRTVDIVVFGSTHQALVETHQGVLLVNPGSPTMFGQNVRLSTVAILDLTSESQEVTIIDLASLDE